MNQILENYIISAVIVLIGMVWFTWRRRAVTVGLPLCYLLSLGMIHLAGAAIYLLPWHDSILAGYMLLGFKEYFAGIAAFTAGVWAIEFLYRRRAVAQLAASPTPPQPALSSDPVLPALKARRSRRETGHSRLPGAEGFLPLAYFVLGILFIAIFIPILRSIPSIGAVAGCGAYLMVVGVCLACWRSWIEHRRTRMFLWLFLTVGFPAFTTLALGFIGYGTVAMLIVLAFVTAFYKPRWQIILASLALIYIGLSAFVTYMRDRTEFREGMEAGEGITERYDRLLTMFSNFEVFDLHDENHLYVVDQRLNQNWLVGMAVANLQNGMVPFARGQTFVEVLQAMVPRIIWPDKPVRAGSPEVVSRFTGVIFAEDTSVGVGQVMEFYINFGRWGVIVGFFCFGMLVRWFDYNAATRLRKGNWRGFVSWFLPSLSLLQAGGSLVEITSSTLASIVLVIGINRFVLPAPFVGPSRGAPVQKRRRPPSAPAVPNALPNSPRSY